MSEWKEITLGNLVTFQRGHDLSQDQFQDGQYPVVSSYGIIGYHNQYTTPQNGVTIGRSGNSIGKPFFVESDFWAHNTTLYVKEFHNSFPKFIFYLLKTINFKVFDSGSAVPSLNRNYIHPLPVKAPGYEEQKQVANTLSCLDRKIENLRKQNETLEVIAQTLFNHWFVDFEFPNEDGKPYKSSGGTMVRSELGEIPTGWRVEPLDKIANFLNGLALQNYPANSDYFLPVIKIREMKSGITANTEKASSKIPNQYVIDNGDVIFSWSGSLEIIIWCFGKGALNQHLFKVSSGKYPKWFYYFWNLEHLKNFRAIAKSKATTMGHIQRKHLSEALCCVPNDSRLQVINFTMSPILEKTIQNSLQIQTLTKTRDVLLPRLMSGKLRIT